jgi:hypothetical protein
MKPPPDWNADSAVPEPRPAAAAALSLLLCLFAPNTTQGATTGAPDWRRYEIVIWQKQTPVQYSALKELGVTAGMVAGRRDDGPGDPVDQSAAALLSGAGLGWYVENIATDFYSAYHKWSPGRPENWRFVEAQKLWKANRADPAAFTREPSLSDSDWLARIGLRLARVVTAESDRKPLYYCLGDETGIGDLAAFWDFDLSSYSLDGMRAWLKTRYASLDALNREWGTHYRDWSEIRPMTTDEAMKQTDNFAAWADFKAWMDFAFANALATGTAAVHAADPKARAGIEGAQIPGWGGYDYSRLAKSVDLMEIYDNGANVEIARSLNPSLVLLTTSFDGGAKENHRIWRELLKGGGGLILWDENHDFVRADGSLGPRGQELQSTFRTIQGGIGQLLLGGARAYDRVAILYSQPSFRTHWMLEWKGKGDAWASRDAAAEYDDDAYRSATTGFLDATEHLGFQPRFVSPALVEQGDLERDGYRILILPQAIALSAAEARQIRRFVAGGGVVIADEEPGLFDEHSRKRASPALRDLFGRNAPRHGTGRAIHAKPEVGKLADIFAAAGLTPAIKLASPGGGRPADVRTYAFRHGGGQIVAFHRDLTALENPRPEAVRLSLPKPAYLFDMVRHTAFGRTDRVTLELDPIEPFILGISDTPRPPG